MSHVDIKQRLIHLKIVYYGTGMGGKTTNLKYIHEKSDPKMRGKMLALATQTDRTLFFDFVPMTFGKIKNLDTRFSFFTVPGQSFYNLSRKAILKEVDGIVFVADSQDDRFEANLDSWINLQENLAEHKLTLDNVPHVLQYNKRDLPDVTPVEKMRAELNTFNAKDFEAIAARGVGVFESMKFVVQAVIANAIKQL
jgi:mutual gliding-motility protein MglA